MRDRRISTAGVERLRAHILQGIEDQSLKPGDRLPPEREMVRRFDAARSAVRRMLADLEMQGRIVRTVGRGTMIAGERDLPTVNAQTSPAELMEARLLFEPAIADLVVTHATPADFERMEECLTRGARAGSVAEFEQWDAALHQAIADATHNSFVIRMLDNINAVRDQAEWGKLKQRSLTPERRSSYQIEHKRLVEALKRRDGGEARHRLTEHLRQVRRNLLDY
ncbi:MAG: lutR 1 [Betaproteobacteria bacterium]|nr:lutR 1 [Betaproteobacteria bacterium]